MVVEHIARCKVGDIAAPVRNALVGGPFGSDLVSRDYVPNGVPVIRGTNMGGGRWVTGPFAYVTQQKANLLSANCAKPGDLVFTQRGTLGQVALIPDGEVGQYLISQSQMKLTVNPEKVNALFLYYVFTGAEQREYIRQNAIQTGVPHTNLGILRNTPLMLPSVAMQTEIAAVLSAFDDKIELNRRINKTLEAVARALFRSWFVDFDPVRAKLDGRNHPGLDAATAALFPGAFEKSKIGHIPAGWTVAPVGEVVSCAGGATPSTAVPEYWEGGTHHWTTPKDFSSLESPVLIDTERRVTDAGVAKISSGVLPVGTLLLSSRAPVGYLAIADIPVAINQGFIAMRCNERASNYFMLNWCQTNMAEIEARATGTTFAEISKQNFRPIPVILPPISLMAAFTATVAPFYARITANVRQSQTLAALRDALLPKLLSGEIRVRTTKISPVMLETDHAQDGKPDVLHTTLSTEVVKQEEFWEAPVDVAKTSQTKPTASNIVPFPEITPAKADKRTTAEFVEAIIIAQLTRKLADPEHPLGRMRYNKMAYLAHRKVEDDTAKHYLKKAAGPYSPWAKYGGPEKIAQKNGYVKEVTVGNFKGFVTADGIDKIDQYLPRYPVCAAVDWVVGWLQFRRKDGLELLATVDFAAVELHRAGDRINLDGVKRVIATNTEWAPKLNREIFSDKNISSALVELAKMYPATYDD